MAEVMELWETLKHAIVAYTGLSPAAFFTLVAVGSAFYHVVSGFFAAPPPAPRKRDLDEVEPLPPPVQLGEITEEELKAYDGSDPKKPLLMAIKGQIYDVTQSRMFYGPGGPYALFAGKDASRALAKMSFEQKDLTGDISGLGSFELDALQDWEYKFMSKYVKVGTIKKEVPPTGGDTTNPSEASENASNVSPTVGTIKKEVPPTVGDTTNSTEASENASNVSLIENHEDAEQARKAEDRQTNLVEVIDADKVSKE